LTSDYFNKNSLTLVRGIFTFDVIGKSSLQGRIIEWIDDEAYLSIITNEQGHDEIARVQTTYDQDGSVGVFRMISKIRSQYSVGLHVREFLRLEGLSDDEIAECFSFLGSHIKSDYELASILYQATDLYREHPGIRHAYLECLNKFQSDIERTRVTQNLFGVDSISGDQQPASSMKSGCLKRLVWVQPLRPSGRTKLSRSC